MVNLTTCAFFNEWRYNMGGISSNPFQTQSCQECYVVIWRTILKMKLTNYVSGLQNTTNFMIVAWFLPICFSLKPSKDKATWNGALVKFEVAVFASVFTSQIALGHVYALSVFCLSASMWHGSSSWEVFSCYCRLDKITWRKSHRFRSPVNVPSLGYIGLVCNQVKSSTCKNRAFTWFRSTSPRTS